jgi:succinyl-diaminopimelate desuccinylase
LDQLVALAERLISYDTSKTDPIHEAAGFIKGWLEARGIEARQDWVRDLPVTFAEVGSGHPCIVLHGHVDVVPGFPSQFEARVDDDRLIGRGAYDMKGALAAMLVVFASMRDQDRVRVRLGIVADEESEDWERARGSDHLVDSGFIGDFALTGEPTNLHIGVEAKGVLAVRLEVRGRAAHGAMPWEGDNAVLKAIDVFRNIESLPFARQSSELFDRPSINLGRIWGGDALNKVPDRCVIDVDIRYLPGQDPAAIQAQIAELADLEIRGHFARPPAMVDRQSPFVAALHDAAAPHHLEAPMSVGRDGASDAVSFQRVGVPAVEFGPAGSGHHGPDEWVSLSSLESYRQTLETFLRSLAAPEG